MTKKIFVLLLAYCFTSHNLYSQSRPEVLTVKSSSSANQSPNAGKIIRNVTVKIKDIFESESASGFYSLANQLKIKTRKEIVERELLFKSGDRLQPFLIEESLRVLRSLAYIRKANIVEQVEGPYVDLEVVVSDTWTLIPQLSYSSGDGRERQTIGIAEGNLLGHGNRIEALYKEDDGITSYEAVWDDRRFLGSDYDLVAGVFDRSDGSRYLMRFEEPFRSLIDAHAWTSQLEVYDGLDRLYADSEEDFIFGADRVAADFSYTTSRGNPSENIHRFSLGYRYRSDSFNPASLDDISDLDLKPEDLNQSAYSLAENRRFSGPLFAYSNIEPDYISLNYIDRFERIEDFNLGDQFGVLTHLASKTLGSTEDAVLYGLSRSKGFKFSNESFLRGELSANGRGSEDGFDNSLIGAEFLYYNVLGHKKLGDINLGRHTLASSFYVDYGDDFDLDRQLSLGADTGLRGYDARTFNGDKRTLLNLEDRIHLIDDAFQLISLGMTLFLDVGGATTESFSNLYQNELYSDIGIGIVLGFPRSSGSRVLRLDLAFPLRDYKEESSAFQLRFIVSGGQTFNARLRNEELSAERPSVAVGF